MKQYMKNKIRKLDVDQRGAVLPLVGLSLAILVLVSGFAIDYTRAQIVKERLQWAVDAGALAGAKFASSGDIKDVRREARDYFRANFPVGYMNTRGGNIRAQRIGTVSGRGEGIRFTVSNITMENHFIDFLGINDIKVTASADVNTLPISPLDVVLSVDVSGSMNWKDGDASCMGGSSLPSHCVLEGPNQPKPGSRMYNAIPYMKKLVDTLAGPNTRFGLVPWDQKVNISRAFARTAGRGNSPLASDTRNNLSRVFKGNANASIDYPWRTNWANPPIERMTYLTGSKSKIKGAIGRLRGRGGTDGSLGMLWANRMFKNNNFGGWRGWRAPADNKVIVFITDGLNTRFFETPETEATKLGYYVDRTNNSNARMRKYCRDAKKEDILIFTIAYNQPNAMVRNLLKDCATIPSYFFKASSSRALRDHLKTIGESMMTMRLTR